MVFFIAVSCLLFLPESVFRSNDNQAATVQSVVSSGFQTARYRLQGASFTAANNPEGAPYYLLLISIVLFWISVLKQDPDNVHYLQILLFIVQDLLTVVLDRVIQAESVVLNRSHFNRVFLHYLDGSPIELSV